MKLRFREEMIVAKIYQLVYFCSMTKGARTREQIIESIAPLFNTKGFEGTSLADLCEATGLTKGGLYGNFTNKEELSVAAFHYTIERMRMTADQQVSVQTSYKKKLIAFLEFFLRYVFHPPVKGGCPLLNTAVEADDYRTSMKKIVAAELERTVSFVVTLIEAGKKAGEFKTEIKSRELALFFFCSVEGAIMFSRVTSSEEAMKAVVKNLRAIVEEFSLT